MYLTCVSRLLVLLTTLQVNCIVHSDVQFKSDRPTLDLDFLKGALLEQHKELCNYEWIASGRDERPKALEKVIDAVKSLLFQHPLIYRNSSYVISKFPFHSSEEAMKYCKAFGGYLAEVNDNNEYAAILNYLKNTPSSEEVLIAGTDSRKEGTWKFQRTGASVPVLDWNINQPDDWKNNEDCLSIIKSQYYKMNDLPCDGSAAGYNFMCELPKVY
ncbi:C-type lectin domain family 4 member F-like [Biomphalaria glabrata]|uniref:C-type lectin domain family 4 member F-like n=1 Tax=Biomphalaria glabrata TaxID=6526 RepID=A0A9W2YDL0_BIOGL|nr:C-type lectin domain family 4 member F-like [Biomphalaria glabrata]